MRKKLDDLDCLIIVLGVLALLTTLAVLTWVFK